MLAIWVALTVCLLANPCLGWSSGSNCSKRLDANTARCCEMPDVDISPYLERCGHFLSSNQLSLIPCLVDCIFNASQVLTAKQLNPDNARNMTEILLRAHPDFVDVSVAALLNCSANRKQWEKFQKRRFFGNYKCTLLPLYLRMCAVDYIYVNCPSSSWKSSKACEEAREHKLNCKCDFTGNLCRPRY